MTLTNAALPRPISDPEPGAHLCYIYETEEEHRAVLVPFLRQGLEKGEKVLYITDARAAETILGYLSASGLDIEPSLAWGQLVILTSEETYVKQGAFDPAGMIGLLRETEAQVLAEGYTALRATGEMTWALRGLPGSERLIEYEARLNEFFPASRCIGLCQYDMRCFDPQALLDVLRTHPTVIIGTELYRNFYYVPPEVFLGGDLPAAELRSWKHNLVERKRVEEALERERTLLRAVIDNLPDLIYAKDAQSRFTAANLAVARLMGQETPDKLLGKTDRDVYPPELAARYYADEQEVIRSGQPLLGREEPFADPITGQEGWLWTTKVPLRDRSGQVVGVVGIGRNVTECNKTEARIEELARFPDENPHPVLRVTQEGRIVYANRASRTVLEAWGCGDNDVLPEEWCAWTASVFDSGSRQDVEVVCRDRVFALTFAPIVQAGYVNVYGLDVTRRKQAEEALQEHLERLEETIQERTRTPEKAQEQLLRQEKLVVLGQLAGGIAHELRNPLGAIKNAAYLVNMVLQEADPEVKEALDIMAKEVARSEQIITSLLEFAQPKSPVHQKVDLGAALREAARRAHVPEDVDVIYEVDDDLPVLLADPGKVAQVFGNIILNAAQAMPEGGQLTIGAHLSSPGWASISFADTGVGIPEENLEGIFEPLFTTKAKGIGLGLALTRILVEEHGGDISVESEVGQGSTFMVSLPLNREMEGHG